MNGFSHNLKTKREAAGMTQAALAEKLYVTRQAVSRWENGICVPDIDMIRKTAEVLGTTFDGLISMESDSANVMILKNDTGVRNLRKTGIITVSVIAVLSAALIALSAFMIKTVSDMKRENNRQSFTATRSYSDIITQELPANIGDYSLKSSVDWIIMFSYGMFAGKEVTDDFYFIAGDSGECLIKISCDGDGRLSGVSLPDIYIAASDKHEAIRYSSAYADGRLIFIKNTSETEPETGLFAAEEHYTDFENSLKEYIPDASSDFIYSFNK